MPFGNFSVGRDVQLVIFGQNGGILTASLITEFESMQETNRIQIKGLDGIVRYLELPQGWRGRFELDRADANLDNYFADLESRYYQGLNVGYAMIIETISNPDGSVSQFQFQGVMLRLSNAGNWKGESQVKQTLEFCASRRLKAK